MKNLKPSEKELIEQITSNINDPLSKQIIRIHNLVAHFVLPENWDGDTQNDLYCLHTLAEQIQAVENEIEVDVIELVNKN